MTVVGQPAVSYTWDNANRLTGITQGSSSVGFSYDNSNRRTTLTLPNGVTVAYTYNALRLVSPLGVNSDRLSRGTWQPDGMRYLRFTAGWKKRVVYALFDDSAFNRRCLPFSASWCSGAEPLARTALSAGPNVSSAEAARWDSEVAMRSPASDGYRSPRPRSGAGLHSGL